MIDFHSHILPNIDDGSSSFEESSDLLKEAFEAGFTKVISTSHYIEEYYEVIEEERKNLLKEVLEKTKILSPEKVPEVYLGSEIYVSSEIVELLKKSKASTINNSNYILFELPMNTRPLYTKELVYKIIENGYTPIIAHPERYSYVQNDIDFVQELYDMGTLFQANYGSIIGLYGGKAKRTVKKLIQMDLIQFLGSDVHRKNSIYPKIPRILKKLEKMVDEEKFEKLTKTNAQKVLENDNI